MRTAAPAKPASRRLAICAAIVAGLATVAPPRPTHAGALGAYVELRPVTPPPSAALIGLDGAPVDLARYRGRIVLLNLWASWCGPCLRDLAQLEALGRTPDGARFAIVAVALDDRSAEAAGGLATRLGLRHVVFAADPTRGFAALRSRPRADDGLSVSGVPTTYIVRRDGGLAGYVVGPIAWASPPTIAALDAF